MNTGIFQTWWGTYRLWSEAMRGVARFQWQVLQAQCGAGTKVLGSILGTDAAAAQATGRRGTPGLQGAVGADVVVEKATECLKQGRAAPREIYDIRNRRRVDWSSLPAWAWPTDPDLFEGCTHEG